MSKHISYDKENDILFIHKGFTSDEKFKGNIEAGELVLDMSTRGRVRGLEILNASKFLKVFDVDKLLLESLSGARFEATVKGNSLVVDLLLQAERKEVPAKIAMPLVSS